MIGGFLVYKYVYNKPHPDYENISASIQIKAEKVFNDFLNDKVSSDELYTGQMIEISGKLAKVEQVDSLVIAVFVYSEGMFGDEGVRCTMLPSYSMDVIKLTLPEDIIIKGLCVGYNDTDVIFENASLIDPKP